MSWEDTLLLIQKALVLLGNASHSITMEWRKIAWSRINPKWKFLATENYEGRESNLFGPGFLEKASKWLEVEKTLSKVTTENKNNNQGIQLGDKRSRYGSDRFLSRGASVQGGNTRDRRNRPPPTYNQFRYFQKKPSFTLPKSTLGIYLYPITHLESTEAGRLKLCSENWRILTSDPWILQAVAGYRLELLADPTQRGIPMEIPVRGEKEQMIIEEIQRRWLRAVQPVTTQQDQFVNQVFLVPKKDGSQRPVVNLRSLNYLISEKKFKMEGARSIRDLIMKGD